MIAFDCFVKHALGVKSPTQICNIECALGYPTRLAKCKKCKHFSISKWTARHVGAPLAEGFAKACKEAHDAEVKSCKIGITGDGKRAQVYIIDEFHSVEDKEDLTK